MRGPIFAALCLALLCPALPATAAEPAATITVSGHGEARAVPDVAHLSAGVETRGETAGAALSANSVRMGRVIDAIRAEGVPARAVRTTGLAIRPERERSADGRRLTGEIDHYAVTNTVSVTLEDAERIGPLVDAVVAAGANRLGQISFAISDNAALMAEARRAAMQDARTVAETLAAAEGLTLGRIRSVSEGGDGGQPRPQGRVAAMQSAVTTPVEPGETTVSARVRVVWTLKPAAD